MRNPLRSMTTPSVVSIVMAANQPSWYGGKGNSLLSVGKKSGAVPGCIVISSVSLNTQLPDVMRNVPVLKSAFVKLTVTPVEGRVALYVVQLMVLPAFAAASMAAAADVSVEYNPASGIFISIK